MLRESVLVFQRGDCRNRGGGQEWLTVPAELQQGVLTPEEVLRRQLAQMGSAGDRYAYVTFEGNARGLPRRIRATLYSSPA